MFVCSLQIISCLDSQSKFQMTFLFTLFSGHHIGAVSQRCTNMAFPYWALKIFAKHFDKYLQSGKTNKPKTWRSVFSIYFLQDHNFLTFNQLNRMVFDLFFYCVTVKTIYRPYHSFQHHLEG